MKTTYKCPLAFSIALIALATLAGCGGRPVSLAKANNCDGPPLRPLVDVHKVPDAVPKHEPLSRIGNKPTYTVFKQKYKVMRNNKGFKQKGQASWYGRKWHGRKTANGETYDMYAMTAAHKNLPLPTYLKVTNVQNGRKVVVRVNDRGPFVGKRILDLSYAAAAKLDLIGPGLATVEIEALHPPLRFAEAKQSIPKSAKSMTSTTSVKPATKANQADHVPIRRTVIDLRKPKPEVITKRPPPRPPFFICHFRINLV